MEVLSPRTEFRGPLPPQRPPRVNNYTRLWTRYPLVGDVPVLLRWQHVAFTVGPAVDGRRSLAIKEEQGGSSSVRGLWERYLATRDERIKRQLVCHYLPLVEFLSVRIGRGVDASLRPDLYSFAAMGLMDAIERFRPDYGVRFETYGSRRIRGAIADGIRSMKWLPRGADRSPGRVIETIVPLDFQTAQTDVGKKLQETLADPLERPTDEEVDIEADHEEVQDALGSLPARERFIVREHYYRRRPLAAIGKDLGVTESRVCQLHRRALRLLESELLERLSA
jgi:RNA polymerase sigma factor FliA